MHTVWCHSHKFRLVAELTKDTKLANHIQAKPMCKREKDSPPAQVKTGFWEAPRRDGQTLEDMVLLLCLLTSRDRTPIGLFQVHFRLLAARVKWDEHQLRSVLKRIESQGEVHVHENWIFVTSWWDHNSAPGPGWDVHIREILAEAPTELIDIWLNATARAGVKTNRWIKAEANDSKEEEQEDDVGQNEPTGGATPGTTPVLPRGTRAPTTTNQKQNLKQTTTTPTTNDQQNQEGLESWDCIELSAEAEDFRDILVEICKEHSLTYQSAREIGWEMSQRLIDAPHDPKAIIYSIREWLMSVAATAATGKNILSRGYRFRKKLKNGTKTESNLAEKIRDKYIEESSERQRNELAALEKFKASAPPEAIAQVVEQVASDIKYSKYAEKIKAALQDGNLPTGPTRLALVKAMRELNIIEA